MTVNTGKTIIKLGTRKSALARWQTEHVAKMLRAANPHIETEVKIITTQGDRVLDTPLPLIGGKGLFTAELEQALLSGEIDCAVHSLKDLPTEMPAGLTIGAIPLRAAVEDALITQGPYRLATLPQGATIGTSSRRRATQLRAVRADLNIIDIRGNVDTRIAKVMGENSPYQASILAKAGLERLGRLADAAEILPLDVMLPAPGQGALAVQCCDDGQLVSMLMSIEHKPTCLAVTAERAFLAGLGGGCSVPVAALGQLNGASLTLRGRVLAEDGTQRIDVTETMALSGTYEEQLIAATKLGEHLAQEAFAQGAQALLEGA